MPREEVEAWVHKDEAVLTQHFIYQRFTRGCSNGPPMLRCVRGQGTKPDQKWNAKYLDFDDSWGRCEPAEICAKRFRCEQCGLYQDPKYFSPGPDGQKPKIRTDNCERCKGGLLQKMCHEEFCTVVCYFCKEKFHPCRVCQWPKRVSLYSPSMWKHRSRGAICVECEAQAQKVCDKCGRDLNEPRSRCSQCNQVKSKSLFSPSMWNHKAKIERKIVCLECEEKNATTECQICGVRKKEEEFTESMWQHRFNTTRRIRCRDCAVPQCKAKDCKTCPQCRNPSCQAKNCTQPVEVWEPTDMPTSYQAVLDFFCLRCRYVKCVQKKPDGTFCSKQRRRPDQAHARKSKEDFICRECGRSSKQ